MNKRQVKKLGGHYFMWLMYWNNPKNIVKYEATFTKLSEKIVANCELTGIDSLHVHQINAARTLTKRQASQFLKGLESAILKMAKRCDSTFNRILHIALLVYVMKCEHPDWNNDRAWEEVLKTM